MTVYFAQARADTTTVKIGYTSDLDKRQKNLSVSSPGGICFLATLPGSRETEDYLHSKFAADRLGGEWFRYSESIKDFIRDLQNGKSGLIPFRDQAVYKKHLPSEYAAEALERAKQMAIDILNAEQRGFRDTIGAAKHRIEHKFGFREAMLHRIIYRHDMKDVTAGVFLHLQDIHEQLCLKKPARQAWAMDETDDGVRQTVAGVETTRTGAER